MPFSHQEKCDMLESYLVCQKNSVRALQHYSNSFPDRELPNRRFFAVLHRRFRNNEKVFEKRRTKKRFIISEDTEIDVLSYFEVYPNNSIRDLSREIAVPLSGIQRILKKHKISPYKLRPVQTLEPGDPERRLGFCRWFMNKCRQDPNFYRNIIWSDEANFSNRGMYNRKNFHYWSRHNPFLVHPHNPQRRFSINVWCGLFRGRIIGPFFYHGSLNGPRYINLLTRVLEEFFDDLDLEARQMIYFQQDGAPAHNVTGVKRMLRGCFGNRWIATNGPVKWPPRSPDMTPLDFYFWGFLKNEVYKIKHNNVDELKNYIETIINRIDGRTVLNATRSVNRRAQICVQQEGGVFEHLLDIL